MIDKIYRKDNYENQQIFHDIEQAKKYSNYSVELNQTFGEKSYEKFYKNLIEHKKARGLNFMSMFEKPKNMTGLKIYDEPFNIIEFKKSLKQMKKKHDNVNYRIKNPYKTRPKFKSLTNEKTEEINKKSVKKEKEKEKEKKQNQIKKENENIYLPDVPELGRYNPSYEVLDKHIYQVTFSKQDFNNFNKNDINHNQRNIFNEHTKIDYNFNDTPINLKNKVKYQKGKIKHISLDLINNMSKTFNKNANYQKKNDINKNISNHYNTSSSLFNSINMQTNHHSNLKTNISTNIEINKSALNNNNNNNHNHNHNQNMTDSQIVIRTNGDIHDRCPKHLSTLYNPNLSLSLDDSLNNLDSFNYSNTNTNINSHSKNNHCLKFETYSKRKPITRKFNYIYEDFMNPEVFNSVYPVKNQNICIEFNKLSTGKDKQKCFFEIEANKNKNPPLGTYFPKYDHGFKKIVDVYINKQCPPITNKRKLRKIAVRYEVPSQYLLFNALNKNKNNLDISQ